MSRLGSRQRKTHEVLNPRNVSPDDIKAKLLLRDQSAGHGHARRSRPLAWRSATTPVRPGATETMRRRLIDHPATRALAYRQRAIELAQQARREDDPGQRRFLLDKARALVNVADALAPQPPEKSGQPSVCGVRR
jgi:hypothetical protein